MSNVLAVIRLVADDGEEWRVPIERVREVIKEALQQLSGSKEFVEIKDVTIKAERGELVHIIFDLETSLLCADTHVEKIGAPG